MNELDVRVECDTEQIKLTSGLVLGREGWQSVAISGNQWQSMAINGNQWSYPWERDKDLIGSDGI
jgi:hypothetical protein